MTLSIARALPLKRIAHIYGAPAQILSIHLRDGDVGSFEVVERDETVVFAFVCLRIAHYLGRDHNSELPKYLFELLLVDTVSKISYKDVGSHFLGALVLASLVYFDGFSEELDQVQQLD